MQSLRRQRVRELLKRAIGEVILREFSSPEAGVMTVNDVGVANDLHSATVFVGIVGTENQKKKGLALLQKKRKRVQSLVSRAVVLKYMPHLRFVIDDSIERGTRVLQIIQELEDPSPS